MLTEKPRKKSLDFNKNSLNANRQMQNYDQIFNLINEIIQYKKKKNPLLFQYYYNYVTIGCYLFTYRQFTYQCHTNY